jgi:RimJ/RimL family protein N-acetyltransferase
VDLSLETQRLILRKLRAEEDDLDSYLSWLRDVENNSFIQSASIDYGSEELIEFINRVNSDDNAILFGIFLKESLQFIGTLKIQPINFSEQTSWLGIMIGNPDFRGQGYGREAIQEVLNYLFMSLKLQAIFLGVDLKNDNAISLYRNLGFSVYSSDKNRMVMVKRVSADFK